MDMQSATCCDFWTVTDCLCPTGWGTNDNLLCEVIGTRSNAELRAAKAAFASIGEGKTIESWVDGEASGSYQDFLLECLKAQRQEGGADEELAAVHAVQLKDALGTFSEDTKVVLGIVSGVSEAHMQSIRKHFDGDLIEEVKGTCGGDWERVLLSRIYTRAQYQATRLTTGAPTMRAPAGSWEGTARQCSRGLARSTYSGVSSSVCPDSEALF